MARRKNSNGTGRPDIIRRLDVALERMAWRQMGVRAIYLTAEDQAEYDTAQSEAYGSPLACLAYSGHQIRRGTRSRVFSTHGVWVSVPKRLGRVDHG